MTVLVTGGSGMLGRVLIRQLLAAGERVRSFDLLPYPGPEAPEVESITGDLRDPQAVQAAVAGCDTVLHTAAAVTLRPGRPPQVYEVNVTATQHIIDACVRHQVPRLIYTSSIDVVFDGSPIRDGDESLPYPARYLDYYGETKAQAEKAVLAANGKRGLTTCVLRPASIYGPHDKYRFPSILRSVVDRGQFVRIGDGRSVNSHVYVGNVAHAHVLAAQTLTPAAAHAGQAYFVTDHEATNFFDFFIPYLRDLGLNYKEQRLPAGLLWQLAAWIEWREHRRSSRPNGAKVDMTSAALTRYSVAATSRDFSFVHTKAQRDFGYQPVYSRDQAYQDNLAWLRDEWLPGQRRS